MGVADGYRQIAASMMAAMVFLGLYIGAGLVWCVALALAVALYFALLLVIPRRKPLEEVMLADTVTAQDIAKATQVLSQAGARLNAASEIAPSADRQDLSQMSVHVLSIRDLIQADPNDYRTARRFVDHYLPLIVDTVEAYVGLGKLAQGNNVARLADLGTQIKGFGPVVAKIYQACIDNDFAALEPQVSALGFQLKRV